MAFCCGFKDFLNNSSQQQDIIAAYETSISIKWLALNGLFAVCDYLPNQKSEILGEFCLKKER
jgi:hypothetical protein